MIYKVDLTPINSIINFVIENGQQTDGKLTDVKNNSYIPYKRYKIYYKNLPYFISANFEKLLTNHGLLNHKYIENSFSDGKYYKVSLQKANYKSENWGLVTVDIYESERYLESYFSKASEEAIRI